jgi:hypothetical protein
MEPFQRKPSEVLAVARLERRAFLERCRDLACNRDPVLTCSSLPGDARITRCTTLKLP